MWLYRGFELHCSQLFVRNPLDWKAVASGKTSLLIMPLEGVAEEHQNPPAPGHAT